MTPRVALLTKKSARNADKKTFDFNTEAEAENVNKESGGLNNEELEQCLNERNEELDDLKE